MRPHPDKATSVVGRHDVLIEAVRTVDRGDSLLDRGATHRLIEAHVARGGPRHHEAPVMHRR